MIVPVDRPAQLARLARMRHLQHKAAVYTIRIAMPSELPVKRHYIEVSQDIPLSWTAIKMGLRASRCEYGCCIYFIIHYITDIM